MIIKPLHEGVKNVVALSDNEDGPSFIESEITEASKQNKAIKGFEALFKRYSMGVSLTYEMFHTAGEYEGQKFHEFRKGRARVYCVIDPSDGSVLLLTHLLHAKSTQKTKTSDLAEAHEVLQKYMATQRRLESK